MLLRRFSLWRMLCLLLFMLTILCFLIPMLIDGLQYLRKATLNAVPKPDEVSKALVMGKLDEDVSWAHIMRPNWTPYVYTASDPPESGYNLVTPSKRGRESTVYLSFIIDHYHHLPPYAAFVHSSDVHWHNDIKGPFTPSVLDNLHLTHVDRTGYVNLRCGHNPGCPIAINPLSPTQADIDKGDPRAYFAEFYQDIFNVSRNQVPEHLGAACCSQFVVSRAKILERPKIDYERMLGWAVDTEKPINAYGVGWVFESLWHVIFGMPPVYCPDEVMCACDLYGACDLKA